ncbi:MAG: caspase family protein [Paludibacteraceae bacterium]|nr:caspase family protein [Paludibacteraceae bacterium]
MNRYFTLFLLLLVPLAVSAQEALTRRGSLNIVKEVKPPILSVVDGSVKFTDKNGNNAIDANEMCQVTFSIKNTGIGEAVGCTAKMAMKGTVSGLSVSQKSIPTIPVGSSVEVSLPVTADMATADGQVTLTISVDEPMGFNVLPFDLAVRTKAFNAPLVKVADYDLNGQTVIEKNIPFDLQVAVQNVKPGTAEDVEVDLVLPLGVYLLSANEKQQYKTMRGGNAQTIAYKMIVPANYSSDNVSVQIKVREKYGKYAENRTISLPLNQPMAARAITIGETPIGQDNQQIEVVSIGSDVDKNIPKGKTVNKDMYVLIFANENYKYKNIASVPFALRDGEVFKQYCEQTLGIADNHIFMYKNATKADMVIGIEKLKQRLSLDDNKRAIVYYTGHGIPDEKTRNSYLLPVDADPTFLSTTYPLNDFYNSLGETGKPVTVFLDACFSGARRDEGMIVAAKAVALRAKPGTPQGKTVVFSAAQGEETAGFYQSQQHGMFTYWLLKELQTSEGDVDYKTLSDHLYRNVRQSSSDENDKIQTPEVQCGSDAKDWQSWKLK